MNQFTALGGALASASAEANGAVTHGDTQNHDPNKEVDGGDDAATTAEALPPAPAAASPLPAATKIDAAFISALVLKPEYTEVVRVDDLTSVAIRKTRNNEFFEVMDAEDWTLGPVHCITHKASEKTYVLAPGLKRHLPYRAGFDARLYTAITSTGEIILYPVRVGASATDSSSHAVQHAVERAKKEWTKLVWDNERKAYEIFRSGTDLGLAPWPKNMTREIVFELGLRDAIVTSLDHPVIRSLGVAIR